MSSAGNNFYLQFFQSVLLPAGWTAPPQHIGEGAPAERLDLGCYSAHIFSRSVVIHGTILRRRIPSMLLSETQFSSSRIGAARTVCRPAVVIQRIISSGRSRRDFHGRVVIPHTFCSFAPPCPVLLFSTHFIPENNAVVIGSTIPVCRIFASRVVKRSTFFAERLFHISIVTESTIQKNSFLWLLYLTLFKNPTQNCDRRIFAQKIFFCVVTAGTL